jgi:aryl-alcohol dehydrogenase-like predicted oxidoreductase
MIDRRKFIQYAGAQALLTTIPAVATARSAKLDTRLIPGTTEPMGIIGLGNSRAFIDNDVATSTQLLDIFLEHGGTYVDVSGSSRMTVGKIVSDRNAQQQTLLGNYLSGQDESELRTEIAALQRVQGDGPLDLAMLRSVDDLARRADEFRALKSDGLVRYVGIGRSHQSFYPGMMKLIENEVVDFIQVNYSMMEPEAADRILPMAVDNGIAVVINRPFLNGDYFGIVKGHELPEWAAEFDCESWAQFSLKYIIAHPGVNCVLTETANPKHALDNLGAGVGRLPDDATRVRMRQHLLAIANKN